jgi:branched-chain amino acid transport system permease protein
VSSFYLQALISGLLIGGVYALIAVGLTLIFGVMNIINFAHGEFLMFGMYFAFFCALLFGVDPYVSAVMVLPLFFLLGWAIHASLIKRVVESGHEIQILLTLGLSLVLQNLAQFLFSPDFQSLQVDYGSTTFAFFGARVSVARLLACGVAIGLSLALYLFLKNTDVGKALRACAEEREGAMAVGIDVEKMYKIAFGLGTACAAIAGVLMTPFFYIAPSVGVPFTLTAFVVVVLGGLGNVVGALLGGLIVGVVESLGEILLPAASLKQLATFSIFILILLLKPSGLFGQKLG